MKQINVTITLDDSDLCECNITQDGKITNWEDLGDREQIKIINSLANYYSLFYKVYKENHGAEKE